MSAQLTHEKSPQAVGKRDIVLVADGIHGPANIGSLFRLADAFGLEKIIFVNTAIDLSSSRLRKTARNTETLIPYSISKDVFAEIEQLKKEGFKLIGLEITSESTPLTQLNKNMTKAALFIGNEKHGLSAEVLKNMDSVHHIDRYGVNSSMNVTHATAIALFCLQSL